MTALESWLKRMVKVAASEPMLRGDDGRLHNSGCPHVADDESDEVLADCGVCACDAETRLEQRIAILLLQTRALENRQLAGMLAAQPPPNVDPASALKISMACNDRSRKLEALATELAKNWPPEWWSEIVRVQ